MLALLAPLAQAAPQVAATIRPLQLIAAAVMDGVAEPLLVLGPGQDPHDIALRPSERRTLAQADLVLWVGPALELPLQQILEARPDALLTAQDLAGLSLVPAGSGIDPHLWLSLANADSIAAALAQRLAGLDPLNAQRYHDNQQRFATALEALRAQSLALLAARKPPAWAVYHHAFQYLEAELGLPAALSITDGNGNLPGVRALLATRNGMTAAGLDCLLVEPGVAADKVRNLLDMPGLRLTTVDILGTQQSVDSDGYLGLYRALIAAIIDCTQAEPHD